MSRNPQPPSRAIRSPRYNNIRKPMQERRECSAWLNSTQKPRVSCQIYIIHQHFDAMSIESLTPATSLENEMNRPHISNHTVLQHKANVASNSNLGGATEHSSTPEIDTSFIRVYADCRFTRSLELCTNIHFNFRSLILGFS